MNSMDDRYIRDSTSLGDVFLKSVQRWGSKTAMLVSNKQKFESVTYQQMGERVFATAKALHARGIRQGDRVALVGETSADWAVFDWACQTLGVMLVPVYPTLPPNQVAYIARDCGAKLGVILTPKLKVRFSEAPEIPVLCMHPEAGDDSLMAWADKSDLTREAWEEGVKSIPRDSVATIIYTSGTTGNPKGVMLTHASFIELCSSIRTTLPVDETDIWYSFLPLSHVFERFAGHILPYSIGGTVAYSTSVATIGADLLAVRPTVMMCVPRFLDAFRTRVLDTISKEKGLKKKIFYAALEQGRRKLEGEPAPFYGILDRIAMSKLRARVGGRVKFFVSGGAALPIHVSQFFRSAGIEVLQGWGLTETCAATCVTPPTKNKPRTVGPPIQGMEIKLAEDGEVLVRGSGVMVGYYNLPEQTAQVFTEDGWFRTGDIGTIDEDGYLTITDRKKDILVLANGKNVAPQPIENTLRESDLIKEIVLFGDGMEYLCALIEPEREVVKRTLEAAGHSVSEETLVTNPETRALIKAQIDKVNKKLADFEKVRRFELIDANFSIETGELTPSLKVKRGVVKERYADTIAKMRH